MRRFSAQNSHASSASHRLLALGTALALIALLVGCGGGGSTPPSSSAGTQPLREEPSAPSAARRPSSSEAPGGVRNNAGHGSPAPTASRQLFASQANAVCEAMRSAGAPAANRAPLQAARSLGEAAALSETINSLLGLRPPPSLRPQVAHLLAALEHLRQLETAVRSGRGGGAGSESDAPPSIAEAERHVSQLAEAVGLPACAPVGQGATEPSSNHLHRLQPSH